MLVQQQRCYLPGMPPAPPLDHPTELLNAAERDLIRRELCVRFGRPPALAEGIFLRVWRSGPLAGQPKVPAAVQSIVDRGLMVVRAASPHMARAYFTEAGLEALRWLAAERYGLDPAQFAHVRQELGMRA
jgi:hypothetical protein